MVGIFEVTLLGNVVDEFVDVCVRNVLNPIPFANLTTIRLSIISYDQRVYICLYSLVRPITEIAPTRGGIDVVIV